MRKSYIIKNPLSQWGVPVELYGIINKFVTMQRVFLYFADFRESYGGKFPINDLFKNTLYKC